MVGKKAPPTGFHQMQILLSHFYPELTLLKLSFAGSDVLLHSSCSES